MQYFPRSREERVLGQCNIVHPGVPYPIQDSYIDNHFGKYCGELWALNTNPATPGGRVSYPWADLMAHSYIDFYSYTSNTTTLLDMKLGQRFPTLADFRNFINDNFPHGDNGLGYENFSTDVIIRIYNPVDNNILGVDRITAYNKFYTVLTGGAHLHKTMSLYDVNQNVSNVSGRNATLFVHFITQAWFNIWGRNVNHAVMVPPAYTNPDRWATHPEHFMGAVWCQKNKNRTLYDLPATNMGLVVENPARPGNPTYRWSLDILPGASSKRYTVIDETLNGQPFLIEKMMVASIPIADKVAVDSGVNGIIWHGDRNTVDSNNSISGLVIGDNLPVPQDIMLRRSCLAVYGISCGNRKAIYIKPYGGVDSFHFPKFDQTKYILEATLSHPFKRDRIRQFPSLREMPTEYNQMFLPKDELIMSGGGLGGQQQRFSKPDSLWTVQFYLRSLETGMVSAPSGAIVEVVHNKDTALQPIRFSVRNNRKT